MKQFSRILCATVLAGSMISAASADIDVGIIADSPSGGGDSGGSHGGNVAAAAYLGSVAFCILVAGPSAAQEKWDKTGKKPTLQDDLEAISMCPIPVFGLASVYARGYRHLQWRKAHGLPVGSDITTNDVIRKALGAQ